MSKIEIALVKTIAGQYQIVDVGDDNNPLIIFHAEFNNELIVNEIFRLITLTDKELVEVLKARIKKKGKKCEETALSRFELLDFDQ